MKIRKKSVAILLISGILFTGFVLGYTVRDSYLLKIQSPPDDVDFSLFWEAYHILEKNFFNIEDIDYQDLVHGAVSGMVDSLKDPHTIFFNPEDTKRFLEDTDGRFEGVGMEVGLRDDKITIIAPMSGSPADKSGLSAGDVIVKINGTDTSEISIEEAVNLIRGPKGTEVVLSIIRDDWQAPREISVIRDVIEIPSIEWQLVDDIAHIEFQHFYKKANDDFKELVFDVLNSEVKGIVLDMRYNSGGYLDIAENIGGWFLEKGTLFMIEDHGDYKVERRTKGTGRLFEYPIVILVNEGSASAAEILAGALRDERGSLIVGKTSFGKGSIQGLYYLSDGSSIKITVANWLTPKEKKISGEGIVPDFEIDNLEDGVDRQLEKAIEVLQEII